MKVDSRPRRVYVDASAYLSVLLDEKTRPAVEEKIEKSILYSSVLLVAECHRNLVRLSREKILDPQDYANVRTRLNEDIPHMNLQNVTARLCSSLLLPIVSTPRTLDLIHLRTALAFHLEDPLDLFVTLDKGRERAASELGLPV